MTLLGKLAYLRAESSHDRDAREGAAKDAGDRQSEARAAAEEARIVRQQQAHTEPRQWAGDRYQQPTRGGDLGAKVQRARDAAGRISRDQGRTTKQSHAHGEVGARTRAYPQVTRGGVGFQR